MKPGKTGATVEFSQATCTVVAQGLSHNHPAVVERPVPHALSAVPLDAMLANGVKLCAFGAR